MSAPVDAHPAAAETLTWVRDFVVRLDLCPFAANPLRRNRVAVAVCEETDPEDCFYFAGTQVQELVTSDRKSVETTLIVYPNALTDFYDFLDFVAALGDFLAESGADALIQLAHFHPAYEFGDGLGTRDRAHATNRSPHPTVQLPRTESVTEVVESGYDVAGIPERNVAKLRGMK